MTTAMAGLLTNMILVVVTTVYVLLTRRLATSSNEAARIASAAAHATTPVQFEVEPHYNRGDSDRMAAIIVTSASSNLYVHGARLDALRSTRYENDAYHDQQVRVGVTLRVDATPRAARRDQHELPVLLHSRESMKFELPEPYLLDYGSYRGMSASVTYSLDGGSAVRVRHVWAGSRPQEF